MSSDISPKHHVARCALAVATILLVAAMVTIVALLRDLAHEIEYDPPLSPQEWCEMHDGLWVDKNNALACIFHGFSDAN